MDHCPSPPTQQLATHPPTHNSLWARSSQAPPPSPLSSALSELSDHQQSQSQTRTHHSFQRNQSPTSHNSPHNRHHPHQPLPLSPQQHNRQQQHPYHRQPVSQPHPPPPFPPSSAISSTSVCRPSSPSHSHSNASYHNQNNNKDDHTSFKIKDLAWDNEKGMISSDRGSMDIVEDNPQQNQQPQQQQQPQAPESPWGDHHWRPGPSSSSPSNSSTSFSTTTIFQSRSSSASLQPVSVNDLNSRKKSATKQDYDIHTHSHTQQPQDLYFIRTQAFHRLSTREDLDNRGGIRGEEERGGAYARDEAVGAGSSTPTSTGMDLQQQQQHQQLSSSRTTTIKTSLGEKGAQVSSTATGEKGGALTWCAPATEFPIPAEEGLEILSSIAQLHPSYAPEQDHNERELDLDHGYDQDRDIELRQDQAHSRRQHLHSNATDGYRPSQQSYSHSQRSQEQQPHEQQHRHRHDQKISRGHRLEPPQSEPGSGPASNSKSHHESYSSHHERRSYKVQRDPIQGYIEKDDGEWDPVNSRKPHSRQQQQQEHSHRSHALPRHSADGQHTGGHQLDHRREHFGLGLQGMSDNEDRRRHSHPPPHHYHHQHQQSLHPQQSFEIYQSPQQQRFLVDPRVPHSESPHHRHQSPLFHGEQKQQQQQQPQQQQQHRSRPFLITSSSQRKDRKRHPDKIVDSGTSTTQDSSYDSSPDADDRTHARVTHDQKVNSQSFSGTAEDLLNHSFKFGTAMPSTVDLKAAVETCDALCKFALHYANQSGNPLQPGQPGQQGSETPPGSVQSSTSSSSVTGASAWQAEEGPIPSLLDAQEFANLQMIRRMNTTMLIGLQNQNKDAEVQAASEGTGTVDANAPSAPSYPGETSGTAEALRFGPGPPTHEMVHELAKAATSIFQLAIRIKSWVNMTPEERLLDEEINIIRGKRCLMMDGALTVPTLDRHGNIQKDWAIVPASSSTSKTFHERQREMEQRQSHPLFPILPQHSSKNNPSTANYNNNNNSSNGGHSKGNREERLQANKNGGSTNGFGDLSNRPEHPCGSGQHFRAQDGGPSKAQSKSKTKDTQLKQSKTKDEPHPKYRKRAKRTQPPGRCLSCDSSDTPEWRRGPDGARTLCNACGLHYAKLLKRQGELGRPEYPFHPNANGSFRPPSSSHIGQLQAIKFPLRRPPQQTTATSIAAGSGSGSRSALGPSPGSETQTQAMEGIVREGDANQDYPGGMSDQRHVVGPRISEIQEEEDQPDSEDDDDQSDTKESSSMKPEP